MMSSQRSQYESTNRYGKTQHLVHIKSERKSYFDSDLQDIVADRKLDGNYKITKSNLCTECNEYKSVNGSCSC